MSLGMHLEIPNQVLDEIKSKKRPMDDLRDMLSEWLKQSDPRPTWYNLADAVEIISPAKAHEIRERFCNS